MEILAERLAKIVAALFLLAAGTGCSTNVEVMPPVSVGVLSAMHQRALNAATIRAVEQAGIVNVTDSPDFSVLGILTT